MLLNRIHRLSCTMALGWRSVGDTTHSKVIRCGLFTAEREGYVGARHTLGEHFSADDCDSVVCFVTQDRYGTQLSLINALLPG